jgi:hypothetical protein
MDLTISRPVQIFALVAVVAIAGGGAMLMMKPKHAAPAPVVVTKPAAAPVSAAPAATATASKPVGARRTAAPAVPVAGPTVTTPKAAPKSVVGANGLPLTIDAALKKHAIVIVSIFDPESSTDAISYAEAKAGANDARVGFVGVSLLDNPIAAALTSALPSGGLLPAPGVLIYRRPGTLVQRIDGFTDRDAVAQAAAASVTAAPMTGAGS